MRVGDLSRPPAILGTAAVGKGVKAAWEERANAHHAASHGFIGRTPPDMGGNFPTLNKWRIGGL